MNYNFTVNTDASFHPPTKTAAYAYWIKSDHYHMTHAALFNEPIKHSGIGELLAIERALWAIWDLIDKEEFLQFYGRTGIISVVFNTDSMFVVDAFNGRIHSPKSAELIEQVADLTEGLTVEFRHVKAHTRDKSARSWVNRWCDRESKKLVKEKIRSASAGIT